MANSRITTVAPGITAEAIATDIHLNYSPVTGSVRANFHFQRFISQDAVCLDFSDGRFDVLSVDFADVMQRKFGAGLLDPVTGVSLASVSAAGILMLMKSAAHTLHNERAAAAELVVM